MNQIVRHILIVLGMILFMPSFCFASGERDSTALMRVWNFMGSHYMRNDSLCTNAYGLFKLESKRRNPTLYFIPTMYSIARGERSYAGEDIGKLTFKDINHVTFREQATYNTVPRNRDVMPKLTQYLIPNLYGETLYDKQLLSPFYYENRLFYKYRVSMISDAECMIRFRPRTMNTQLVKGWCIANYKTGQVKFIEFEANYDMTKFKVTADYPERARNSLLPKECSADVEFKFIGNHIDTYLKACYGFKKGLPDSVNNVDSRAVIDSMRPQSLNADIYQIYNRHEQQHIANLAADTLPKKKNWMKHIFWDVIGDNLVNSQSSRSGDFSMRLSPLFNPFHMSYSMRNGLSYKLTMAMRYELDDNSFLSLNPRIGYNFKLKQFYFNLPLRWTYNNKRNGYVEATVANGNRISSGTLVNDIKEKWGVKFDIPEFKDLKMSLTNYIEPFSWLGTMVGVVFHKRRSLNPQVLIDIDEPYEYRSFAPTFTVKLQPWRDQGPVLTVNYEWGIKNVFKSNLSYERYEFDAVYKHRMSSMRTINLRAGTGFYTMRNSNYFVDFSNFRDNNLPSGWDDDWSAQFQLLDSRWYNESNYYVRGHASYDTPLLMLAWMPFVGKIVEMERLYASMLNIEHTRLYTELGYGFSNRFFSTGIFVSFLNARYREFGCKFTIELFRRW